MLGAKKYLRPINRSRFIFDSNEFKLSLFKLRNVLVNLFLNNKEILDSDKELIDNTLYTIQQSIGAGFDLLVNSNSARKHVGNRFEKLIRVVFTEIGIANKKSVLQIPYSTEEGEKIYKCENDLIISPYDKVRSTGLNIDEKEIVVSVKTTSKDRMGKMFIDKILLERFTQQPQKVIGIFLNDVQRKESNNISFTLVSGLFMVYSSFLIQLDGIYYLDPPPNSRKEPLNKHMKPFSEFITRDVWQLFSS